MSAAVEHSSATTKPAKLSKNALRRAKKKADKQTVRNTSVLQDLALRILTPFNQNASTTANETKDADDTPGPNGVAGDAAKDIEKPTGRAARDEEKGQNTADADMDVDDPLMKQFQDVFAKFSETAESDTTAAVDKPEVFYDDDNDDIPDEEKEEMQILEAKRKKKTRSKLTVAELKAVVPRPELVEWTDTSAPDPQLLISLRSARNAVPVPGHWGQKRQYLSSKRGIEKAHYNLPKFIAETGIGEMRDAALEKEAGKSLKQKQRDRVAPKTGKLDIDYQKLYEAFFKHQTKPELTGYGEVYYEGKEHETNMRHLRPGDLSDEMRQALGMPPGLPPPWLMSMQRFGPPKSYPSLKLPGVNAPLPPGASWGYEFGQWGNAPVDQFHRPLWGGDLFGSLEEDDGVIENQNIDRTHWGELQQREPEEDEEEEEEDDDEEDEEEAEASPDEDARGGRNAGRGRADKSGIQSALPVEIGTMEDIEGDFALRKEKRGPRGTESELPAAAAAPRGGGPPRQAGMVLKERNIKAEGFFGGERAYDLSQTGPALDSREYERGQERGQKRKAGEVEVSVDMDSLASGEGLSKREMQRRYDESRQEEGRWKGRVDNDEDLGDMVAEEGRKRVKKDQEDRERRRQGRR